MRELLVGKLRCPTDLNTLQLDVYHHEPDGHIITGQLKCTACQRTYPIQQGVPNLVPADKIRIDAQNLDRLQATTAKRFGFEWRYFRDWGWLTKYPNVPNAKEKYYGGLVEHTHSAFWSKSLFQKEDLYSGLLVLDAGCGNGRFTNEVAQTGAEVSGIDLGLGVHSAFEHTRTLHNVHIVQGDLFRLPFSNQTFDRIFSIGVLMHTGNASAAFDSLVRTLRVNGLVVAHVYGKGELTYEIVDSLLRLVTTRLPIAYQVRVARGTAAIARWLRGGRQRLRFYNWLFKYFNLLPTEHHMYDWWSAPIAKHHTLEEVLGWFSKNKLEIVCTNPPLADPVAQQARRRGHGAITVLGRRSKIYEGPR
jgi:SAM-dependent methyltransferase